MPKVWVVSGGYTGFYPARHLEKQLRRGEAEIALVQGGVHRVHR